MPLPLPDETRIAVWTGTAPNIARGEVATRLRLAQAFAVRYRDGSIEITLERPGVALSEPGPVRLVAADAAGLPRTNRNVVLMPMLGGSFGTVLSRVDLTIPGVTVDQTYVAGVATGAQRNDHVELDDGQRRVVLRVEPLTLASGLRFYAQWLLLLFLAAGAALTWPLRRSRPLAAMLLGAAETLLTLRVLISIEGGMVDGTERAMQALPASLVALPLGTMAIVVALAPDRRALWPAIGFPVMAGLALWLSGKTVGPIPTAILRELLVLTMVIALAAFFARAARPLTKQLVSFGRWSSRRAAHIGLKFDVWGGGMPGLIALTLGSALLILLARILLISFGLYEAATIGDSRFALSVVFIPLTLVVVAPLLARVSRARSAGELGLCFLLFIFFFGIGVLWPNIRAGDEGVALVLSFALAIAAAAALLARAASVTRETWIGAGALGLLTTCVIGIWAQRSLSGWTWPLLVTGILGAVTVVLARRKQSWPANLIPPLWLAPLASVVGVLLMIAVVAQAPIQPEVDQVAAMSGRDWDTRLRAVLAPNRFAQLITDDAVNLRTTMAQLHDYGATRNGRDFLNLPLVTQLRNQQFSDYGAAIHLISPFGRWGVAGLILMLGGLATAGFGVAGRRRRALPWSGALAIAGLAAASTYIILANALAAPFTGRNVYLLAINSNGDLIEGLALLAIGAATLCRRSAS